MKDRHVSLIGLLALAAFSFGLYNWVLDYVIVLQYQKASCFFMFGRAFLADFLDVPGGLLLYAGRFLGQFYYYKWLGALVISCLVVCLAVLIRLVLRKLGRKESVLHTLLPCVLLLALHCRLMERTVGALAACACFAVYLSLRGSRSRLLFALVASPALYLLVGAYLWFFAAWVTASAWLDRSRPSNLGLKLLYPALTACVPFVAYRWLFAIPLRSAFISPAHLPEPCPPFHLLLAAYLLVLPFWARMSPRTWLGSSSPSRRNIAAQVALLVLFGVGLVYFGYSPSANVMADYHQLYKDRQWDAILSKATQRPSRLPIPQFITNYALCRRGKLLDEMFTYPQAAGTDGLVLPGLGVVDAYQDNAMYDSDLFFAMGHVNAAFRLAYDHMCSVGRTYANVRRVAECNMVNGDREIADKYLDMLGRTLFHRRWARRNKRIMADPNAAAGAFGERRARLPTVELDVTCGDFVPALTLVKGNPHNRMALDYLAAWYLLDVASLPMMLDCVDHFAQAGYSSMPTHCQEALLVLRECGFAGVDEEDGTYDVEVAERVSVFKEQMSRYSSKRVAQRELEPAFGGTYMYYYVFGAPASENRADSYWDLGNAFCSLGRLDDAFSHFRQAVRYDPVFAGAHAGLADLLTAEGRNGEADRHRAYAARLESGSRDAHENLHPFWPPRAGAGG